MEVDEIVLVGKDAKSSQMEAGGVLEGQGENLILEMQLFIMVGFPGKREGECYRWIQR